MMQLGEADVTYILCNERNTLYTSLQECSYCQENMVLSEPVAINLKCKSEFKQYVKKN